MKMKIVFLAFAILLFVSISPLSASDESVNGYALIDKNVSMSVDSDIKSQELALIKKAEIIKEERDPIMISQGVSPVGGFTQAGLLNCSNRVRNWIETNGKCPNYVDYYYTSGGQTVTARLPMPDYLYLISKVIEYKYDGKTSNVAIKSSNVNPTSPSGVSINGQITKANFYIYAKNVAKFIEDNGPAPNYLTTNLGKMQYQTVIYMFSRIGQYIYLNNAMPSYVTVSVPISHSMNKYLPDYHPSELI
ncbi:pseudomurein-binding repeat protein [Methanobrevibacter cuticularis]|uniref:Pseudomurein-binding repeat protein n=1 Tax=Methanobrevibacter cuticularis TaxID=47311 RepID=A0A166DTP9_9EURY|nr:pseudomurein-binding repeat-containing protein [Methanobrevibacter cuticularis]KZX15942.1 pseudomurein-binding repeat protein [Methanobrevibacter cuticularis]